MRFSRLVIIVLSFLLLSAARGAEPAAPAAPASPPTAKKPAAYPPPGFARPPRLATTEAELASDKLAADYAGRRDAAIKAADAFVQSPVPLPEGYGSWIFYYACPDDGSRLKMITLTDHECPKCKKHFSDERTVAAYRCEMHYALENAALALGWGYIYSGDDKYAREAKRILLKLADDYDKYPERIDRWGHTGWAAWGGGRRYVQSLDEAVGAIKLAKAYDLTRNSSAWTDPERQHVEKDFFRATATSLLLFNERYNNHQTWYNAGLLAIASVLGDAAMVDKVLTMDGGYFYQLKHSIGDDGLWYEGALVYQQYAMQAMIEIVEAARRMGIALHEHPRFKSLVASPLKVAYPDGQFACINDSDPAGIQMFSGQFQWAWGVYHDPVFAQAAAWRNPEKLAAMLGRDAKPVSPLETHSIQCDDAGVAILRAGQGDAAVCAFLHYGPHGGGHGHNDKLGITLFANGREWLVDIGRIGYEFKEYQSWAKRTVAHNTVVLGGIDQRPNTGELLWLASGENYTACAAESTGAYDDVTLRRYLLLTPDMLVDVFDVSAAKPTKIDWLAHAIVEAIHPVEARSEPKPATLGTESGYQHLADCRAWPVEGTSRWDFVGAEKQGTPRLRMWLAAAPGEEIYTATGIGHHVEEKAPCLVRRRQSEQARFVTVYDLGGKGDRVTKVEAIDAKLPVVKVECAGRLREIHFEDPG